MQPPRYFGFFCCMTTIIESSTGAPARSPNRLSREKSPYLLQHQYNPVDWYAWGEEAFTRARQERKPIFLSIGYSTCHWCHVMERESFEDEGIAQILNRNFVCIKVDREERPDVDRIYMTFVQATSGQGGWPLNCFLTPELKAFYAGTYFPPDSRYGRPGFPDLLNQIHDLWVSRPADLLESAASLHEQIEAAVGRDIPAAEWPDARVLELAARQLKELYDPRHGGFGNAPKFPQPSNPAFLLRAGMRFSDEEAVRMVLNTCDHMAAGGIHDQLGGGFARYSVDAEWLVPHFEKMLYDNAQLVPLYLDAGLVSGEERYAQVARDIVDYVLRDMTHPDGGFYSAEDADSEGKEGKFYCWTRAELSSLLTPEEFNVAVRYYGITEHGNFVDHSDSNPLPNQNVLSVTDPKLPPEDEPLMESARAKMLAARAKRVRPHRDDKILASWNGLMLGAVARAYAVMGDENFLLAAERNLFFLRAQLWDESSGTLYHRWREGERDTVQLQSGYACLLSGVLDLYEATLAPGHLEFAVALADSLIAKFFDDELGGFWQSGESKDLILRVKEDYDGAEPSGNSVATLALLKLAAITGIVRYREAAEKTMRLFATRVHRAPQSMPYLLLACDFALKEPRRVVLAGDPARPELRKLLRATHSVYQPSKVVMGTAGPVEPFSKALPATENGIAYLCTGTECQPPTQDAKVIRRFLR